MAGAWTSKQFNSEAAAWQLFLGLQSEPTLILECTLEGENLSISYAYWGLGDVKPRYETCMRFSWLEVLYGFVKERTENWFRNRAQDGTSEAEWIADCGGEEVVAKYQANQAVIKREQMWLNRGEDIRELPRNYHIMPKDWDQLKSFVALCHIMIAGWVTDEYFLLNTSPDRHLSPLLPELLPELLKGMSKEVKRQFIDPSVEIYLALYEAIIRQVPDWEPELRLELAASLIKLPSKDAGIPQVNASLKVWLSYRGIDWHPSTPVIPLLAEVAKPEDESYFNTLYQVWELLGITDRVDMGNAYYRRGEDFLKRRDYEAACRDFERAITLGYVKAAERREIALHLQAHIREEALKPQVAEGQKKNDDFSNGSVIAAAVLAIGIMALENWSLEQAKQQAAKVQLKSAVGMDYRKLRDLLAVGKWQEADEETKRVMSEVLKRGEVNVVENIIDNFSCEDLYTIDQLWVKCSNGKFGFSVQKRIYQSLGGTKREIWNKFIEKVGWKGQDVAYQLKAPSGHLPNVPGGEMVF